MNKQMVAQEKKPNAGMSTDAGMRVSESFEVTPELLEFTEGADTRNITIKHCLCLRKSLPKTRLSQAILYENVSYRRQLDMKMESMKKDRLRNSKVLESNIRAFQQAQRKKQQKWKRLDEERLQNMALPCVSLGGEHDRPKSCKIMYRMNEFKPEGEKTEQQLPVLPKMNLTVRRELTEIITHREKTFMTKFPELYEIEPKLLEKHNNYCGKELLEGGSGRDDRFNKILNALSPAKRESDDYPIENLKSYSRLYKYSNKGDRRALTPRSARLVPKSQQQNLKEEIARRFMVIKSREHTMVADENEAKPKNVPPITTASKLRKMARFQKRGEYFLETYKSDDVIHLSNHRNNNSIRGEIPSVIEETESVKDKDE